MSPVSRQTLGPPRRPPRLLSDGEPARARDHSALVERWAGRVPRPAVRDELDGRNEMKLMVTGAAGFIGSTYVRIAGTEHEIVVLDKLTYAGRPENLPEGTQLIEGAI